MGDGGYEVKGQDLRVAVEDLRVRAARLDMTAQTVRTQHGAAHAAIARVLPHFGDSVAGAAISDLLSTWEQETQAHHHDVAAFAERHRSAAAQYSAGDDSGRQRIESAESAL
jgi:hypothetical protein